MASWTHGHAWQPFCGRAPTCYTKIASKKRKFEVLIDSNLIDHNQFKEFFKKSNSGDSELSFKILHNQHKVEIKSDQLFQFNFNEISNLKRIDGVLDVLQIN